MFQQYTFNLRRSDIDASADDQVIIPRLILEEAVFIPNIDIAGNVPALPDVSLLLVRKTKIPATSRSLHGQQTRVSVRDCRQRLLIDHHRLIAGDNFSRLTRSRTARARRYKNVQHLGRTDTIQDLDSSRLAPGPVDGRRKGFTGADDQT